MRDLVVISCGPLMVVRIPTTEAGELIPRWRSILKAMTPVMRTHGCKQKDIHALEQIEAGLKLRLFWLYTYNLQTNQFDLVRKPEK